VTELQSIRANPMIFGDQFNFIFVYLYRNQRKNFISVYRIPQDGFLNFGPVFKIKRIQ